ncbi:hypothetical protein K3W74_14960, partial [Listeria monocytogenes]|nr:hypothetical protein [Listeria monocytogenes]
MGVVNVVHADNAEAFVAQIERRTKAINDAANGISIARDVLKDVAAQLAQPEVDEQALATSMVNELLQR